jgi:hypothetical protein
MHRVQVKHARLPISLFLAHSLVSFLAAASVALEALFQSIKMISKQENDDDNY